jgi:hypothetical protein
MPIELADSTREICRNWAEFHQRFVKITVPTMKQNRRHRSATQPYLLHRVELAAMIAFGAPPFRNS